MKIAMVAPFEEAVPPLKYGGTELVVYNIVTELVALGHEVTVFGSGDSKVPCRLVPVFPQAVRTIEPYVSDMKAREAVKYLGIAKVVKALSAEPFDIVHNHIGWRFLLYHELIGQPVVTTLHGPMHLAYQRVGYDASPGLPFVSISDNQRKAYPSLNYVRTVYNGIDTSLFQLRGDTEPVSNNRGQYLFLLGRMSPEKGVKEAIDVAKSAGMKLIIAAKVDSVDLKYYEEVKPMIDGTHIEFIGEINFAEKVDLIKNAYALLAPIQWEEPFGLNLIEAMACGTPVLGMSRGSFPEIIENGRNGYLSSSVGEMSKQVADVAKISRNRCRAAVEERFTKAVMARGYLEVYNQILEGKK